MSTKVIDGQKLIDHLQNLDEATEIVQREAREKRCQVKFKWGAVDAVIAEDSNLSLIRETVIVLGAWGNRNRRKKVAGPYPLMLKFEAGKTKVYQPKPSEHAHLPNTRNAVRAYQVKEEGWATGRQVISSGKLSTNTRDWYVWPGDWFWMDPKTGEVDVCSDEQYRHGWIV